MSFNPVGSLSGYLGQQVGTQPGAGGYDPRVAGDASTNQDIVPVPGAPGLYINLGTGQVMTGNGNGQASNNVVQAPNANMLTTQDQAAAQAQQIAQQQALARLGGTLGMEDKAIGDYGATIAGTAPSAAKSQLATGFNQIAGQQEAIAAGATGENRNFANRTMAQNIAGGQAAENGQAALLRANETSAAEAGRTGLLGAEGNQLGNLYSSAGNNALGYGSLATTNQGNIIGADEKANEANAKANAGLLSNIGGGLTSLAALM